MNFLYGIWTLWHFFRSGSYASMYNASFRASQAIINWLQLIITKGTIAKTTFGKYTGIWAIEIKCKWKNGFIEDRVAVSNLHDYKKSSLAVTEYIIVLHYAQFTIQGIATSVKRISIRQPFYSKFIFLWHTCYKFPVSCAYSILKRTRTGQ